jgi:hypothetical protein
MAAEQRMHWQEAPDSSTQYAVERYMTTSAYGRYTVEMHIQWPVAWPHCMSKTKERVWCECDSQLSLDDPEANPQSKLANAH